MFSNIKKTLSVMTLAAGMATGAMAQAGAGAVPATSGAASSKVGVIDIRRVIAATNEGRRDYEALIKKFEPKQKEVDALKTEVEQLKQQLQSAQNLTDADRATRVRTIEQKDKSLQRVAEDAQNDFNQEQQAIIGRIGNKLMDVVDKYARQNNFAMIVDANADNPGPVLWASEQVNISQAILDAYNAQSGVTAPAANAPSANRPATPAKAPAKAPAKTPGTPPKQ